MTKHEYDAFLCLNKKELSNQTRNKYDGVLGTCSGRRLNTTKSLSTDEAKGLLEHIKGVYNTVKAYLEYAINESENVDNGKKPLEL